jgi:hypothetical protein
MNRRKALLVISICALIALVSILPKRGAQVDVDVLFGGFSNQIGGLALLMVLTNKGEQPLIRGSSCTVEWRDSQGLDQSKIFDILPPFNQLNPGETETVAVPVDPKAMQWELSFSFMNSPTTLEKIKKVIFVRSTTPRYRWFIFLGPTITNSSVSSGSGSHL